MKLYLHVFDKTTPDTFDTVTYTFANQDGTLEDLFKDVQKVVPQGYKLNSIAPSYKAKPYPYLSISASSVLDENDDLFVEIEKPVSRALTDDELSELFYEPITKYKFYENDEKTVRVVLEFKAIDKHPKEKIHSRFLDRSFEIKILDYGGKNLHFAVPKLQCKIKPAESKFWVKGDKLIIQLAKFKNDDNWFALFRTKAIGDDDD